MGLRAFGTADASAARHNRAIETMVQISDAPSRMRSEQAILHDGSAVSALPACSDGFDDVDGGPECGVYIQMRGIEQVRILRAPQGGRRPGRIALVPAQDVGQH